MTILLSVIALVIGAIVGWVVGSVKKSAEVQRALAERDLARTERERSEAMAVESRRLANAESQARAVAESQARFLGDATQFWRVCDANRAMWPDDLMVIGESLRITLPEGIPGAGDA